MSKDAKEDSGAKITLGQYLASIRADRRMTLRQVEEATENEVSNAYLSQIENHKFSSRHRIFCTPFQKSMELTTAT